jgi:predicted TPR repeat methyltransferase
MGAFRRQAKDGDMPLLSNPTIEEVRASLRANGATRVLEVGCGWGRLIEGLSGEFDVQGCDVSEDMLRLCPSSLRVFHLDVAVDNYGFLKDNVARWDVVFTRGVMLYFMEVPIQMAYAMNNMMAMARTRVIVWEWPEVCARMQDFCDSDKFEYRPIEHRSE